MLRITGPLRPLPMGEVAPKRTASRWLRDAWRYKISLSVNYVAYFDAVFLFAMLTTCTRRFMSASGLAGSLSLLLP